MELVFSRYYVQCFFGQLIGLTMMMSLIYYASRNSNFFNLCGNTMMPHFIAKFRFDTSTNNKDTWGGLASFCGKKISRAYEQRVHCTILCATKRFTENFFPGMGQFLSSQTLSIGVVFC